MKKTALLLFGLTLFFAVAAQKTLTLKECIDSALKNNQQVTDATYFSNTNKIAVQQARAQRLPNININLNQGLNTGRSIDPFSNQFIDQTIRFGNYGLGLDFIIFNGMQINNTIKRNKANLQAGEKDAATTKNIIALNVIRNYLQVISSQEIAKATALQLMATQQQLNTAQQKVRAGVLAASQLADLNGQVATEKLNLTNAKNNIELAKLDLFATMNFVNNEPIILMAEEQAFDTVATTVTANDVYDAALKYLPDMQTIEYKKRAAEIDRVIAKGVRYPTLVFFANTGSTYSSSVHKTQFVPDGTTTNIVIASPDNFISVGGSDYFILQKSTVKNGSYKPFTYFNQLNGNINSAIGLSLRIPILNGLQAKYKTLSANAAITRIEAQLASVKNQLRNAVQRSVQNLQNAGDRILLTEEQVAALQQTLTNSVFKIDNGTSSATEYVIAKSNYDKAKINLIQAKYEYRFLQIIVQFYQTGTW